MNSFPYKLSCLFLLLFCVISCSPSLKKQFKQSEVFQQGFAGLAVYDLEEKRMLEEYNSNKYFTPASNTKLLTLYAGLKLLGDSVPAIKHTIIGDSLIFKGTGDPSFLNPELPQSKIPGFLKNNNFQLFYVAPPFVEKPLGPGWAWDDYDSYYSAEKIDFPIYGNLIEIKFDKGSSIPEVKPELFKDSVISVNSTASKNKYAQREISSNKIAYQNFERDENFTQNIPIKFSHELIAQLLSDTLHKKVEVYKGDIHKLRFNKTLYSISSDSIYKRMMQVSDNFIAEQILLMAADKVSDSLKTSIAIDYMNETYFNDLPDEFMWYDGSGLSRYNLFTPRSMVKLIEKIEEEMPKEELFKILAAGGESGTLKNYYKAETPYIYAKTGTLRNNHSLSGFLIAKSGRILIFSFMNRQLNLYGNEFKMIKFSI